MKATKMIVPILMGVLMAFAMIPMTTGTAYATEYPLYIGGTQVKTTNCDNIKQGDSNWSGNASYDPGSRTLTLQDFENKTPVSEEGIKGSNEEHGGLGGELTIKLRGKSHIKVESAGDAARGINYVFDSLVIKDDPAYEGVGELIIDVNSNGWGAIGLVTYAGNLTISECKVTCNALGAGYQCWGVLLEGNGGGKCTVENGFLKATAAKPKTDDSTSYSYGIADTGGSGDQVVNIKDTSEVIASGYTEAIKGPVINGITGKGWTNVEGTEGEEGIDISDTERGLRNQDDNCFKKVHFRNFVPLTIAATDQIYTYDGQTHGESGSVYADAQINEKVSVKGLRTSDKLVNVTLNGSASNASEYPINVSNAVIKNGDDDVTYDYIIDYIPGKLTINPDSLNVTVGGSSAKKTYNGKQQTYNGTVTAKSSDPSFDASKFRYTGSTTVKGTKTGVYTKELTADDCAYNDPNFKVNYTVGSPIKLTITENKKPEPKPVVNKAAAKTALDAGVVAKSSGSKVTASWGAVKGASSYVIYANYCDQKKCKKIKTVSGKTTSFNITKLNGKKFNPKKNLKFYVVAYKTVKGKKVKLAKSIMAHAPGSKNSKRTNVTGVKVKKASFTLKKGKTAKIKAKLVLQKKSKKPLKHCAKFRYASSNKKVAKVSKKGKITAVGKGKCTVYVYAVSGVSKKIKVTVK